MAGISLAKGANVLTFGVAEPECDVLTVASNTAALPGTDPGSFKITPLDQFPTKGRATGGVRCHTFRKTENTLVFAAVAASPLRAAAAGGAPLELPTDYAKRDATGTPLPSTIAALAGRMTS
jgi:DNA gyrase subunit A